MEVVAIIAAVAVAVLQIITISVVNSLKKKVEESMNQKPASSHGDRERRDRDFRQQNNKRPVMDSRPKMQTQPATTTPSGASDQVEKSLRDINLKLKNAERDQENARKKIQSSTFSKDHNSRDNNRRRDNRDNNSRGGRDSNRNNRRGGNNWQDRNNRQDGNQSEGPITSENNEAIDKVMPIEEKSFVQQQPENAAILQTNQPSMEPSDFNTDDGLQHGRKVTVKRRMLKEEDSIIESSSSENEQPADQMERQFSNESDSNAETTESNESGIKFGRR